MSGIITRAFALDDIAIRSGGDGRTVEAYAAVFDRAVEIKDGEGHYLEAIDPTAFNRTIAHKGTRFGVFYNHAKTIYGTPSERGSMPIGTPLEVKADAKGVLTVTRYNKTPLADEVLASIANGDMRGQSFSGRFTRSNLPTPRGGFRPDRSGGLKTVVRTEIDMREYGPTPFPAYEEAAILGVRSLPTILEQLRQAMISCPDGCTQCGPDGCTSDCNCNDVEGGCDSCGPDCHCTLKPEGRAELARLLAAVTPSGDSARLDASPDDETVTADPPANAAHSTRQFKLHLARLAREKGILR